MPATTGPLAVNPNPTLLDAGPLGQIYVTGIISGLGQVQDNVANGDARGLFDLSNGQVFVNKTSGPVQFFAQGGGYSLPDLGAPYLSSDKTPAATYGAIPQAFVKLVPSSTFSIEAGKLPTLIGAEYTWSFENMNIQRGLVWNQENAVNRGVQANYAKGPLSVAVSWNDGFYSNIYSWLWLSVSDTLDKADSLSLIGGGNTKHTSVSSYATPLYQNNEDIYNVIFTHTAGPWTIEPYVQYTYVPKITSIGAGHSASTTGGALFVNYAFPSKAKFGSWNLPVRAEYITSSGTASDGAPNLLYGPGSKAWSITVTPTYQYKIFFTRFEASYVQATSTTAGDVFGPSGNDKTEARALIETGILF